MKASGNMKMKYPAVWFVIKEHTRNILESSRSGTNGKPIEVLNCETYDKIVNFIEGDINGDC